MSKHKTPWFVRGRFSVIDSDGYEVAFCDGGNTSTAEDEENAAHIMKCVNAHDDLVAALSVAHRVVCDWPGGGSLPPELAIIEAALKKAGAL